MKKQIKKEACLTFYLRYLIGVMFSKQVKKNSEHRSVKMIKNKHSNKPMDHEVTNRNH